MAKTPLRKEFDKLKKRKGFYSQFGGKTEGYEVHHKTPLSQGGDNSDKNLCYVPKWWHYFIHKLYLCELIKIKGKRPSVKKLADSVADAEIERVKRDMFIENVILEFESRKQRD